MSKTSKQSEKRNPIRKVPLPQAGDSARRKALDILMDGPMQWAMFAVAFFGLAVSEWVSWLTDAPRHPVVMTLVAVVFLILAVLKWRSGNRKADQWALGSRGERSVAQTLDVLRQQGYRIFHDIPGDGYNIDHVLIGPGGVFVIETKTVSKPDKGHAKITYDGERVLINGMTPDRDPIKQVRAGLDAVAEILTRAGCRRPKMQAVVVYPDWWVERQPADADVWVLNPKALVGWIDHAHWALDPPEVALLASTLEIQIRALVAAQD